MSNTQSKPRGTSQSTSAPIVAAPATTDKLESSLGAANGVGAQSVVEEIVVDPLHPLDEGGCYICKKNDRQDLILLCDGCEGEFHTFCVDPPLKDIPEDEWFCSSCKAAGKGPKPPPSSRYTGVTWAGVSKAGKDLWQAKIRKRARGEATIGTFDSQQKAAKAYDDVATEIFGDSAELNFPDGKGAKSASDDKQGAQAAGTVDTREGDGAGARAVSMEESRSASQDPMDVDASSVALSDGEGQEAVSESESGAGPEVIREEKMDGRKRDAEQDRGGKEEVDGNGSVGVGDDAGGKESPADAQVGSSDAQSQPELPELSVVIPENDDSQDGGGQTTASSNGGFPNREGDDGAGNGVSGDVDRNGSVAVNGSPGSPSTGSSCGSSGRKRTRTKWLSEYSGSAGTEKHGEVLSSSAEFRRPGTGTATKGSGSPARTGDNGSPDGSERKSNGVSPSSPGRPHESKKATAPGKGKGSGGGSRKSGGEGTGGTPRSGNTSPSSSSARVERTFPAPVVIGDSSRGSCAVDARKSATASPDAATASASVASASRLNAKKKRLPWGVPDFDGRPRSKEIEAEITESKTVFMKAPDGTLIGEDGNHFFCSVCGEHGDLTCCDKCPRVFHYKCLVPNSNSHMAAEFQTDDDPWFCPTCVQKGERNKIGGVEPNWAQLLIEKALKSKSDSASLKRKKPPASKERPASSKDKPLASRDKPPSNKDRPGISKDRTPASKDKDRTPASKDKDRTPASKDKDRTPASKDKDRTPASKDKDRPSVGKDRPPAGRDKVTASKDKDKQPHASKDKSSVTKDRTVAASNPAVLPGSASAPCAPVVSAAGRRPLLPTLPRPTGAASPRPSRPASTSASNGANSSANGGSASASSVLPRPTPADTSRSGSKNIPRSGPASRSTPAQPAPAHATSGQSTSKQSAVGKLVQAQAASAQLSGSDSPEKPPVSKAARVFVPELDNLLLRSLLYEEKYIAVPRQDKTRELARDGNPEKENNGSGNNIVNKDESVSSRPADDGVGGNGPGQPDASSAAVTRDKPASADDGDSDVDGGGGAHGDGDGDGSTTSRGGGQSGSGAGAKGSEEGASRRPSSPGTNGFRAISPRARTRPVFLGNPHGSRLGPGFGVRRSPYELLDGTAATFGARAKGSFRAGLAASMVLTGLVPPEIAATAALTAGWVDREEFKGSLNGRSYDDRPVDRQSSSGPPIARGRPPLPPGQEMNRRRRADNGEALDHASSLSDFAVLGADCIEKGIRFEGDPANVRRISSWKGKGKARERGAMPLGQGRGRSNSNSRSGFGKERMGVEDRDDKGEDEDEDAGVSRLPPNLRRGPPPDWTRKTSQAEGSGTVTPVSSTNPHRRWNLKHMRAMADDGARTDVCCTCRSHPDGAAMVCPNPELSKMHAFCFACLEKKEGIEKSELVTGKVKWECPACRQRSQRPTRRATQAPAAIRGSDWERGNSLSSSQAGMAGTSGDPATSSGRAGGPEGSCAPRSAGMKRPFSQTESSRGDDWVSSPGLSSPGGRPYFDRGSANASEASASPSRGVNGAALSRVRLSGGPGSAFPASAGGLDPMGLQESQVMQQLQQRHQQDEHLQSMERKRLLRLVIMFALDRLQELDPLDFFAEPVPPGVPGYAETIRFPIDFATIRRRAQWEVYGSIFELALDVRLLCANAQAYNGKGSVYFTAAATLHDGAMRLWPQAQALLDALWSGETTAAAHGIRGPASSSETWPLDGHVSGFELTPANEDAYYMHLAIRRTAAACRGSRTSSVGSSPEDTISLGDSSSHREPSKKRKDSGARISAVASLAASSAAMLYSRGEMGKEESLLRDSLSAYRAQLKENALGPNSRENPCARCSPIEREHLGWVKQFLRPLPTPLARREAAPDEEFLGLPVNSDQPGPLGPIPRLKKRAKPEIPSVTPEWKVNQAADVSIRRAGDEASRAERTFQKLLKVANNCAGARLIVAPSGIQGLGLHATQPIPAHELLIEYVGEVVRAAVAQRRSESYRRGRRPDYIVRLDNSKYIDATHKGNVARYVNHSCVPNCYMTTVVTGKDKRVCLFSLRDIHASEEITYRYPPPETVGLGLVVAPECKCKAPGCRGRMSTREEL